MAEVKPRKKWYAPQSLAERANDGFLGLIRSTGSAIRLVNHGTTSGLSKVTAAFKEDPEKQPNKAPAAQPLPKEPKEPQAKKATPIAPPKAEIPAPAPLARKQPTTEEPAAPPEETAAPRPTSSLAQALSRPFSAVRAVFAGAPASSSDAAEAAATTPAQTQKAPTAPAAPDSRPEAPSPTQPTASVRAPETKVAKPAVATRETKKADVDAWLNTLSLPERSQRVRLRSAYDDLVHGSAVVRRTAAAIFVTLGKPAEPILVACAREAPLEVVEACIEILIRIGSDAPPALVKELAQSPDPTVRMTALRVSRCLENHQQKPILLGALHDPTVAIRRRALTHLAWSHPGWAPAEILRLCYDPDPTVKWAALEALVAMDPNEARGRLDTLYPDMDPLLRRRAVRLLERQPQSKDIGGPIIPMMAPAPSISPKATDRVFVLKRGSND